MMLSHGRPDGVKNKEETNSLVAVVWNIGKYSFDGRRGKN
jgi:hypothetical protein